MTTNDPDTRRRLVETASRLFAERGFEKVTVREICTAARANVAAVNYHFGDKQGLYREVVQSAVRTMRETTDATMAAGRGASPEDQLRAYVRIFLRRLMGRDNQSWIHKLMLREMEAPTDTWQMVVRDVIVPRNAYLAGIVSRLTGLAPDDDRVLRAIASVQGQLFMFGRPMPKRLPARWGEVTADVEANADFIAAFTLAGLKGLAAGTRRRRA